eukprot:TRINITY_DN18879_c0_g2_i2.p2 TRINITY_DN18879_c0_g2~~TRINITY_DN18879_c0_g2_i2.p2  ORF type:complete len:316 (+),score=84.56 TRINITY_DN18879_c0_g2_i2:78-950(+)
MLKESPLGSQFAAPAQAPTASGGQPAPDAVVVSVIEEHPAAGQLARPQQPRRWGTVAAVVVLVALALLWFAAQPGAALLQQLKDSLTQLDRFETFLLSAGAWGPLWVVLLYLITTVCMLPLWGFHITCGYVYGTLRATALISVSQLGAACCAFALARHTLRPTVRGCLSRRYGRSYAAIDRAVARDAFRVTALLRLAPLVPFGVNNYLLGCTEVALAPYAAGTWLGVLPGTFLYCNLGALGRTARQHVGADSAWAPQQVAAAMLGVAGVAVAVPVLARLAARALREVHDV